MRNESNTLEDGSGMDIYETEETWKQTVPGRGGTKRPRGQITNARVDHVSLAPTSVQCNSGKNF